MNSNKPFQISIIFLIISVLFSIALFYNKKEEALAQEELSSSGLKCEKEIPIGKAIDEAERLGNDIYNEFKFIYDNSKDELIPQTVSLSDLPNNLPDNCSCKNCDSSITNEKYKYCSQYISSWSWKCNSPPSSGNGDEGGGNDGGGGGYDWYDPGETNFFSPYFYSWNIKNYTKNFQKIVNFFSPSNLCNTVFAHDICPSDAPVPDSPCEYGGDVTSNETSCDSHCTDADCTTCYGTKNKESDNGQASSCSRDTIDELVAFTSIDYEETLESYERLTDLIDKDTELSLGIELIFYRLPGWEQNLIESASCPFPSDILNTLEGLGIIDACKTQPQKVLQYLNYSRDELESCKTPIGKEEEVFRGEIGGKFLFSCSSAMIPGNRLLDTEKCEDLGPNACYCYDEDSNPERANNFFCCQ